MGPLFVFLPDFGTFRVLGHCLRSWLDSREGKAVSDDQRAHDDGGKKSETFRVKKLIFREHHPGEENLKEKV